MLPGAARRMDGSCHLCELLLVRPIRRDEECPGFPLSSLRCLAEFIRHTLPESNIGVGIRLFPFGMAYFQGRFVSFEGVYPLVLEIWTYWIHFVRLQFKDIFDNCFSFSNLNITGLNKGVLLILLEIKGLVQFFHRNETFELRSPGQITVLSGELTRICDWQVWVPLI